MKHARPMPDFEKKQAQVKLTTAAILRDGHLLKKEEEVQAKILNDLEWNQRDDAEFNRWKAEMGEKDEIERIEHMQKSKSQGPS